MPKEKEKTIKLNLKKKITFRGMQEFSESITKHEIDGT